MGLGSIQRCCWVRHPRPKSMKVLGEGDARRNPTNGDEVLISIASERNGGPRAGIGVLGTSHSANFPPSRREGVRGWAIKQPRSAPIIRLHEPIADPPMPNLRARRMRNHPTEAESLLWQHLRRSQILGRKFRRQEPIGPYIVDFICSIPCWSSRLMARSIPG